MPGFTNFCPTFYEVKICGSCLPGRSYSDKLMWIPDRIESVWPDPEKWHLKKYLLLMPTWPTLSKKNNKTQKVTFSAGRREVSMYKGGVIYFRWIIEWWFSFPRRFSLYNTTKYAYCESTISCIYVTLHWYSKISACCISKVKFCIRLYSSNTVKSVCTMLKIRNWIFFNITKVCVWIQLSICP